MFSLNNHTVLIFVTAGHVYADKTESSSTTITASPSVTHGGILNFDLARHPLTLDEMKLLIDALQISGFSNLSLRLGDSESLMYQSTYLQNTNLDVFSTADFNHSRFGFTIAHWCYFEGIKNKSSKPLSVTIYGR